MYRVIFLVRYINAMFNTSFHSLFKVIACFLTIISCSAFGSEDIYRTKSGFEYPVIVLLVNA